MPLAAIQPKNSKEMPSLSLGERVQSNWQNRKVEVVGSGVSIATLAGGVGAATLFGGPLGLIVGLAVATLLPLGLLLKSLLAQPKTTQTTIPTPNPTPRTPKAAKPASLAPARLLEPKNISQQTGTYQKIMNTFSSAKAFVTEHPFETAFGTALAVYGLYAGYKALTAKAALAIAAPTQLAIAAPTQLAIAAPTRLAIGAPPVRTPFVTIPTSAALAAVQNKTANVVMNDACEANYPLNIPTMNNTCEANHSYAQEVLKNQPVNVLPMNNTCEANHSEAIQAKRVESVICKACETPKPKLPSDAEFDMDWAKANAKFKRTFRFLTEKN